MIIGKIKSLLAIPNNSNVKTVEQLVGNILSRDYAELSTPNKQLTQCLDLLETEVTRVRLQATEYSNYSIKKEVWLEGVALVNYAKSLATFLSDTDCFVEQEKATQLWAQAALGVCSHQHHIVGPAMIASAGISERTGKIDHAVAVYNAVLEDFQDILAEAERDELKPDGDSLIALESLHSAATKLVELNKLTGTDSLASSTLKRIDTVLVRPSEPKNED